MFTGLIQAVGTVQACKRPRGGAVARLEILPKPKPTAEPWRHLPALGSSIAISGCCLTLVNHPADPGDLLVFEVVPQTLAATKLGALKPGDRVNLEHACTPMTLLGGHLVQGHVDAVARVQRVCKGADYRLRIALPPKPDLAPFILPKGSITIDGVSLTVAEITPEGFEVALIPATLAETTLGGLKAGDPVNLEVDLVTKTLVHSLASLLPALFEQLNFNTEGHGEPRRKTKKTLAKSTKRPRARRPSVNP